MAGATKSTDLEEKSDVKACLPDEYADAKPKNNKRRKSAGNKTPPSMMTSPEMQPSTSTAPQRLLTLSDLDEDYSQSIDTKIDSGACFASLEAYREELGRKIAVISSPTHYFGIGSKERICVLEDLRTVIENNIKDLKAESKNDGMNK